MMGLLDFIFGKYSIHATSYQHVKKDGSIDNSIYASPVISRRPRKNLESLNEYIVELKENPHYFVVEGSLEGDIKYLIVDRKKGNKFQGVVFSDVDEYRDFFPAYEGEEFFNYSKTYELPKDKESL